MTGKRRVTKRPAAVRARAKRHLKYIGIIVRTRQAYVKQLLRYFYYLDERRESLPEDFVELDASVSEYVNALWMKDDSHGYASTLISALSRFLPACRGHLRIFRQYVKNLERTFNRQ